MSNLTLFHHGPSTCSQKVRLILGLKDLTYAYNLHAAKPNQVVGKDSPNQKSSSGLDQYLN